MWKNIAQALKLDIPEQQMDAISPVLDALWAQTRQALDRDQSAIDPAFRFDPDLGGDA